MCRAVGLPARYIEGYISPPEKDENGVYIVTNRQGHAWAEVYFEGYGWQRFDPTPAENSQGRIARLPASEDYLLNDENTGEMLTVGLAGADYELSIEPAAYDTGGEEYILSADSQSDNQDINVLNIFSFNLFIAIVLAIAAVIIYISARFLYDRRNINKISRKLNNEAAAEYYKLILKYLRFFDYEKSPYETAHQFAKRINGDFAGVPMENIADIISKACYGNGQVNAGDVNIIKRALNDLDNIMRSAGRVKYLYYRYIKRVITV
jgi:hypothetical protein